MLVKVLIFDGDGCLTDIGGKIRKLYRGSSFLRINFVYQVSVSVEKLGRDGKFLGR